MERRKIPNASTFASLWACVSERVWVCVSCVGIHVCECVCVCV